VDGWIGGAGLLLPSWVVVVVVVGWQAGKGNGVPLCFALLYCCCLFGAGVALALGGRKQTIAPALTVDSPSLRGRDRQDKSS
jgi:predicted phage tail protein